MEIVLERIGPKKDIIVVNKEIFSCGRMKDNDIICLSLLVSRKHCTFSRFPTTLYVSDLGSSNGVYINGVKIEEKKSIPLNDNDIVGIGCNEIKNLDDSMYVFRVKKKILNLNHGDNGIPFVSSSSNNCLESDRQSLKEQSKARKSDLNSVPSKIVKCSDHRVQISCTNEDDCIEIIECTSTSNTEGGQSIPKSKTNDVNFCTSNVVSTKQEISEVIPDVIELSDSEDAKCKINVECLNNGTCTKNIEIKSTKISEYESVSLTNDIPNTDISIPSNHEHVNNQEQLNDANHDIVSVKEEPDWSHFSQIDVVEIDNDHDNNVSIFTYSQNFEQAANIKIECENEDDQLQSSLFFDDEDDNVITILDSDEDNIGAENNQVDYSQLIPPIKIEPELRVEIRADSQKSVDTFQVDEHLAQPNLRVEVSATSKPCVTYVEASTLGIYEQSESVIINTVKISNIPEKQKTFSSVNNKDVEEHVLSSISKRPKPSEQESEKSSLKDKVQKKIGIKIVEPHHLKTSRRSRNSEKDSRSRSNSRHEFRQRKSHSKLTKHKDTTRSSKKKGKNREFDNDKDMNKELNFKDLKNNKKNSAHEDLNSNNTSKKLLNMSNENSIGNTSNSELQNQSRPKYRTTKVKVKVSQKSRGDMLCDSMLTLRPEHKKNKNLDEAPIKPPLTRLDPVFVIPRRQMPSSTNYNNINVGVVSSTDSIPDRLNSPPPLNSSTDTLAVIPNIVNHAEDSPPRNNSPSPSTIEPMFTDAPFKDQNLKPSLTIPSLLNNRRKTVSFNDTPAVKEFQIIDGNKLRNIKDGLSLRSTKKDFVYYKQMELKIEDFLARVFVWEPIWLQQQNEVKSLPPIVKHNDKQPLPLVFNSFQQYYKRMEVLLLLETWQQLLKEFQCTGIRYHSAVVLPCQLVRHSVQQMQTPNGLRFSSLAIYAAVSRTQLQRQNHPVYGDMVILEYVIKDGNTRRLRRAFAYVTEVQQQSAQKFIRSHETLCKSVSQPDVIMTYSVQTRLIDEHTVEFDQLGKMRSILYIRSHLRLIQAIQYVPHSPLRDSVLDVNIDGFQMKSVTNDEVMQYKLITKDKLNEKQLEAIIKFTNASVNFEPKIGLLVGPPGTGKSKVIANLVMEMLYGNGRYVNGQNMRILVCAPSNAAIDEIVLRLLDIRAAIKEHRFKMVRIGRIESMHEDVKKISLVELARNNAQKQLSEQKYKNTENIEAKKHQLKKDIDALQLLVANNPLNKTYKKDLEIYRAKFLKLAHRSPEEDTMEVAKLQNNAKNVILAKADVITCTLTSCYTKQMESIFGGDRDRIATCIVDEATQCCEAETLIPLMLGVKSLILVGDPNQLPATVMSTDAKKLGLDRSLFTRAKEALEPQRDNTRDDCRDPIITLNVQYRMVNAISYWPNRYFYGGKLIDSVNYKQNFPFQPYRVLNLDGYQDETKFSNLSEATFVGNLLYCLMTCLKLKSGYERKITIGVITPYQNQKSLILSTIREQVRNVPENMRNKFITEVNTIDSFQGQERDVIIMSCVRSSGIGFLSDQQRLCVALTRAKFTLILCGNFSTFEKDNMWKDLIKDARSRGVVANLNTTARPNEIRPHVIK